MVKRNERQPCSVILTAVPVEYQAVRRHLHDIQEEVHPQGNVYEYGTFAGKSGTWKVVLVEAGAGNTGASRETERAITHFKPDIVLFVGIAGGVKDVQIGDVVAVTKAYGYESGKVQDGGFLARPDVGMSSFRLIERAKAEARNATWLQRIPQSLPGTTATPHAFVGSIAAGEKVIASTNAPLMKFLHTHYNDTLAIEMEGRGFLEAAHANAQVQALIIRGISDLLANKSTGDAQGSQEVAASHASAFAFEVLAHLEIEVERKPEQQQEENVMPEAGSSNKFYTNIHGNVKTAVTGDNATINYSESHNYGHTPLPAEIYFSFAQEDEVQVKQLQNQLAFLLRRGLITIWSRDKVIPGQVASEEIRRHLYAAPVILLCISPDYLASDLCNQEMHVAVEREDAIVIPILLRRVAGLKGAPFAHLQGFPRNGRAISEWGNRKEIAFAEIAEEMSAVVAKIQETYRA